MGWGVWGVCVVVVVVVVVWVGVVVVGQETDRETGISSVAQSHSRMSASQMSVWARVKCQRGRESNFTVVGQETSGHRAVVISNA